ncbi:MAG: ATP diphosphatase [Cycloclasticus sp.]|jgi:ATP diphosphatase
MSDKNIETQNKIDDLLHIMSQLRDPDKGCPWDLQQNFETIAPYTIEEAYEVAEAIQQSDMPALRDELGDLLFQVVFHSRLAEEQHSFSFDDVLVSICEKLRRRHPHVFDNKPVDTKNLAKQWEAHKRDEKALRQSAGVLDDVDTNQPAMNQAYKLQKKASAVGFDWDSLAPVLEKLDEEVRELKDEIGILDNRERLEEELGDVMFSCINLARHLDINPEWSLRKANKRFSDRFAYVEQQAVKSGTKIEDSSLETLEAFWQAAKKASL